MPDYSTLKPLAVKLRTSGFSLNDICERLNTVPKGTVYSWIRDIKRPAHATSRVNVLEAVRVNKAKWDKQRQAWMETAQNEVEALLTNPVIRDFIILFSAEGSRKEKSVVSLVNTDPHIVLVSQMALRLLVPDKEPSLALLLYADHDPDTECAFWREFLSLPFNAKITVHQKASHGLSRELNICGHGIMRIRTSSTLAKMKVDLCLEALRKQWSLRQGKQ
jgi:hypothetical protein